MDISAFYETETGIMLPTFLEILSYCKEKSFRKYLSKQPATLSPYKNGIERLQNERPSDIINFRCLLPKVFFRVFCFELENLLNKLVKLSKANLEQKYSVLFSSKESTYFPTGSLVNTRFFICFVSCFWFVLTLSLDDRVFCFKESTDIGITLRTRDAYSYI